MRRRDPPGGARATGAGAAGSRQEARRDDRVSGAGLNDRLAVGADAAQATRDGLARTRSQGVGGGGAGHPASTAAMSSAAKYPATISRRPGAV